MKTCIRFATFLAIGLTLGSTVRAADAPPSIRALFLKQLDDVEKKLNGLAQATPADKYGWRPGAGVRSISEVFVHVAGANFFFPTMAGVPAPAGLDPKAEKNVTDKAAVQALLKKSFAHAREAAQGLSDEDMAKPAKMFGQPSTVGAVFFTMATHMHEHLGQAIAYARTNGVVPPWSAKD
jgi:uncharacterized damage-inducible protein DinB